MEPVQQPPIPKIGAHLEEVRRFESSFVNGWFITDFQVVQPPEGSASISGSYQPGAFNGVAAWFKRATTFDTSPFQRPVLDQVERHKRIYQHNLQADIVGLSREDIRDAMLCRLSINNVVAATQHKFTNATEKPLPQDDILKAKFIAFVTEQFRPLSLRQREYLERALLDGRAIDDPEVQTFLANCFPLARKFLDVYPDVFNASELLGRLKVWLEMDKHNREIDKYLSMNPKDWNVPVIRSIQSSLTETRLERFLVENENSEADFSIYWRLDTAKSLAFLRSREAFLLPKLSPRRLAEGIAIGWRPSLNYERFIQLTDHLEAHHFREFPGWNRDNWRRLLADPSFLAHPKAAQLLRQDDQFYYEALVALRTPQPPALVRIMAQLFLNRGTPIQNFPASVIPTILNDQEIPFEVRQSIYQKAGTRPEASLKWFIEYHNGDLSVSDVKEIAQRYNEAAIKEAIGPLEKIEWDGTKGKIKLIPYAYPKDFLKFNAPSQDSFVMMVPFMSPQQVKEWLAANPPLSERNIVNMIAQLDDNTNKEVLIEMARRFPAQYGAVDPNYPNCQLKRHEYYCVALKELPEGILDYQKLAQWLEQGVQSGRYARTLDNFVVQAYKYKVDPAIVANVLIHIKTMAYLEPIVYGIHFPEVLKILADHISDTVLAQIPKYLQRAENFDWINQIGARIDLLKKIDTRIGAQSKISQAIMEFEKAKAEIAKAKVEIARKNAELVERQRLEIERQRHSYIHQFTDLAPYLRRGVVGLLPMYHLPHPERLYREGIFYNGMDRKQAAEILEKWALMCQGLPFIHTFTFESLLEIYLGQQGQRRYRYPY